MTDRLVATTALRETVRTTVQANDRIAVVVVGAGGHGKEIASYISGSSSLSSQVQLLGFVDDNDRAQAPADFELLGSVDRLGEFLPQSAWPGVSYITALGDPEPRQHVVKKISALHQISPWTLVHPSTLLGPEVTVGDGTCIAPGAILTTNIAIGDHVIINAHVTLSHDGVIGDFATIGPGAIICGNVTVGSGCSIGAGATLIQGVSAGDWSVIGAGAVVVDDVPPYATVVGVPARVVKQDGVPL